jgi:hypothetical protein
MDHAEARELLELAAVEPNGLDRLMAGDTPDAAALAGHLAGCSDCAAELARLRRASIVIRDVIRTTPSPDLRARTLAFVAAVGRDRSGSVPEAMTAPVSAQPAPIPIDRGREAAPSGDAPAGGTAVGLPGRLRGALWAASLAAAVIVSVAASSLYFNRTLDARFAERDTVIAAQGESIAGLAKVSGWSLRLSGMPDAERVHLASTGGQDVSGTLLYVPTTKELVVVATGLTEPPAGREFRCWVEKDGQRIKVGKMFFGGGLAYWVGEVERLDDAQGARFGVSLTDAALPDDLGGPPVIAGEI